MRDLIGILTREENVRMQYELLVMLLAFSLPAIKIGSGRRLAAVWAAIAAVFLYLHRILLPVLVSGLYLYVIAGLLAMVTEASPRAFLRPARRLAAVLRAYLEPDCVRYILAAVLVWMLQDCRANIALDYDSLRYGLRSDVLLTGGKGLRGFFENTGLVNLVYSYPKGFEVLTRPLYFGHTFGYVLAVNLWILLLVLLLAGEIVHTVSGSRNAAAFSIAMLALMPGITNMAVTAKSDLGTLLCQLIFILCVMLYLKRTGACAYAEAAGPQAGKKEEAADPQAEKKEETADPQAGNISEGNAAEETGKMLTQPVPAGALTGIGVAALIASFALKPTALIFSTAAGCLSLWYLLRNKTRIRISPGGVRILGISAIFTSLMTIRTWRIAGMPFTSLFTGIFEKMGMQLKYPLRIQRFSIKASEGLASGIRFYLTRLWGVLFCPTGEDMAHVRMAWGGLAFLVMLILVFLLYKRTAERMEEMNRMERIGIGDNAFLVAGFRLMGFLTLKTGILSILSLYLLYQIDGNYYMLLYALTGMLGSIVLYARAAYEVSPAGRPYRRFFSGESNYGLLLLTAVMLYFTAFTGWAGPVGFTPIDPVNRGYYNHEAELPLMNPLQWDKHTRVVAFAGEPDCYLLRGRVESWVDLDGSGGNVYLTDTKLNIFKEYLTFAEIDYIYADLHFLQDDTDERHARANTLFIYMLEDGDFESVVLAEGSSTKVFAKIDKERMAVGWEEPLPAEKQVRTDAQRAWFESIGGYRD